MFTAWGIMHRRCCLLSPTGNTVGALYNNLQTQSSAPEDGRNYRPKHVELIVIVNKLSLLYLVGCLLYYNILVNFSPLYSIAAFNVFS